MEDIEKQYPIVLTQETIWGDMDAFGHVNNTVYFRYFEDARMAYFEQIGVLEQMKVDQIGPILASTRCDFRAPLAFPDTIRITASIVDIAAKRFTMNYRVYSQRLDRLAAEGEGLIVYFDYQSSKSCEIPTGIRTAIERLESR